MQGVSPRQRALLVASLAVVASWVALASWAALATSTDDFSAAASTDAPTDGASKAAPKEKPSNSPTKQPAPAKQAAQPGRPASSTSPAPPNKPAPSCDAAPKENPKPKPATAAPPQDTPAAPKPFDDIHAIGQGFADELARLKDDEQTVSPAELFRQAEAQKSFAVTPAEDAGPLSNAEAIYARARRSVVIVGGLYHCPKCERWHVRAASGFVIRRDGLIVTNFHVLEGYKGLEAIGVRTDAGRVLGIKSVPAASRLNDLALVKVDADDLQPLPIARDVAVGATVYCLSHPSLSTEKTNAFFAMSHGIVAGRFTLRNERQQPYNVLAITADYGLGSSGGPILNDRGAVVGVACQAIPQFQREQDKGVMMVWRLARPSSSLLPMLREPDPRKPPRRLRPRGPRPAASAEATSGTPASELAVKSPQRASPRPSGSE